MRVHYPWIGEKGIALRFLQAQVLVLAGNSGSMDLREVLPQLLYLILREQPASQSVASGLEFLLVLFYLLIAE
jgi:hypothetical protein